MSLQIKNESRALNQYYSLFNSKLFLVLDNKTIENDKDISEYEDSFELNEFDKINKEYFLLNDLIQLLNSSFSTEDKQLKNKNYITENKFNTNLFGQNNNNDFFSLQLKENGFFPKDIRRKNFKERKGDWVCKICNNLNFAFRTQCNICKSLKENSAKKIFC